MKLKQKGHIDNLENAIISVLKYFGIFRFPLTEMEIHRFSSYKSDQYEVNITLSKMLKQGIVFKSGKGYYSLVNDESWTENRETGFDSAITLLNKSHKYVRRISRFPFVLSIAISGSLSKFYSDDDWDIDYFIITKKNRLWISRTLLHFFKKFTFIGGNEHYYCMNYFVDETALEIDQKNVYAAIETVTLLPVYNKDVIFKLKEINQPWIEKYLPNESYNEDLKYLISQKNESLKRLLERIICIFGADRLNRYFMKVTDRKWRNKWQRKNYPMDKYNEAFYTALNISKNHPANFQSQILNALEGKTSGKLSKNFEECEM
jgi:hypothetical protein